MNEPFYSGIRPLLTSQLNMADRCQIYTMNVFHSRKLISDAPKRPEQQQCRQSHVIVTQREDGARRTTSQHRIFLLKFCRCVLFLSGTSVVVNGDLWLSANFEIQLNCYTTDRLSSGCECWMAKMQIDLVYKLICNNEYIYSSCSPWVGVSLHFD